MVKLINEASINRISIGDVEEASPTQYSKAEVRAVANEAIWRLEEQIRFLRENFEIEAPNRTPAAPISQSTEPEPEPEQPQFFADMDLTIEDDMLGSLDDAMG